METDKKRGTGACTSRRLMKITPARISEVCLEINGGYHVGPLESSVGTTWSVYRMNSIDWMHLFPPAGAHSRAVEKEREGSLLLRAILELACSLARDFLEGKRSFIFASPDGEDLPFGCRHATRV